MKFYLLGFLISLTNLCHNTPETIGSVQSIYDHLNDEQLKNYCKEKRELSKGCVQFAQFIEAMINYTSPQGEEASKSQRENTKKLGKIIQAISKEIHAEKMARVVRHME
jgi:hypothetical protein